MSGPELAVRGRKLSRRFGDRQALKDVDLEVPFGATVALLGPNGSGKTTLLRILAGLISPGSGEAEVLGRPPDEEDPDHRRRIAYCGTRIGLYGRLTCAENLWFAARLYGLDARAARARVEEVLDQFGMSERAGEPAEKQSTGLARRLGLARAVVARTDLLILDEPTSGLDPQAAVDVLAQVRRSVGARTAIVMATHDLPGAAASCDQALVLVEGRKAAAGRPDALLPGAKVPLEDSYPRVVNSAREGVEGTA